MKNELKKFLTLGAALAGSALMVSCDGSDGQNGTNGTNGIDGNSPNLPVAAPASDLLALARLTATVENSASATFDSGQEIVLDLDSARFGDILTNISDTNVVTNIDAPIELTNYQTNGSTFTFDSIATRETPTPNFSVTNPTFTVTNSLERSLVGTFTATATTVVTPLNAEYVSNGDNPANYPTTLQIDGVDQPRSEFQAYFNNTGTNPSLINFTGPGIPVEFVDNKYIGFLQLDGGNSGALYIINADQFADRQTLNILSSDITAADAAQVVFVQGAEYTTLTRVTTQNISTPELISGSFVLDLNTAGTASIPTPER